MRKLAHHFDNPQNDLKVVHVAGTNGKGSVSLKVQNALTHLGFKTGMFTSPHVNCFRERFQINGQMITEQSVVKHCEAIFDAVDSNQLDMRFFEIVTMIALLEFREQNCEYAVMECGIGGFLDATNIIDKPVCSTITSVGLDHMDVIGNTIEDVAKEKSGVIKQEIPCILGPTCWGIKPFYQRANEMNSPIINIDRDLKTFSQINNSISKEIMNVIIEKEKLEPNE